MEDSGSRQDGGEVVAGEGGGVIAEEWKVKGGGRGGSKVLICE